MIDVQVERPVTIKANGKTIRLTNEEARELVRKLSDAIGISTHPTIWPYPIYYTDSAGNDWMSYTTSDSGDTTAAGITVETS